MSSAAMDRPDFSREIELLREVEAMLVAKLDPPNPKRDFVPLLRKTREVIEGLGQHENFWRDADERYGRCPQTIADDDE